MTRSDVTSDRAVARVWITRTEPAASRLAEHCRAVGLDCHIQPLLQIQPLAPAMPSTRFDVGICLSVHAAEALAGQAERARRWVSVGEATARKLARSLGVASGCVEFPQQATSEALLAMLDGQLVAGDTVLIACGVGGRGILEAALAELGCLVSRLELYQRRPRELEALPHVSVVEIASAEALNVLAQSDWDKQLPLIVASNRLAELAATNGFENVHNSGGAEPSRVAEVLAAVVSSC